VCDTGEEEEGKEEATRLVGSASSGDPVDPNSSGKVNSPSYLCATLYTIYFETLRDDMFCTCECRVCYHPCHAVGDLQIRSPPSALWLAGGHQSKHPRPSYVCRVTSNDCPQIALISYV
jgi:hypothetical protein